MQGYLSVSFLSFCFFVLVVSVKGGSAASEPTTRAIGAVRELCSTCDSNRRKKRSLHRKDSRRASRSRQPLYYHQAMQNLRARVQRSANGRPGYFLPRKQRCITVIWESAPLMNESFVAVFVSYSFSLYNGRRNLLFLAHHLSYKEEKKGENVFQRRHGTPQSCSFPRGLSSAAIKTCSRFH